MVLNSLVKHVCNCLNPIRIQNKYTGEFQTVSCGKCSQCLNIKSFNYKKSCETEGLSHRYKFFVTLSYDEQHLPSVHFETTFKRHGLWYGKLIDDCKRSDTYGQSVGSCKFSDYQSILKKRYNPFKKYQSPVSYALTSDLQKYIKRVRRKISKVSGEKIRYFAVSDYGGKFLRAHFHLLFYFDDPKTFEIFREVTIEKWKFGDVDSQATEGDSTSYVSSYVTGSSLTSRLLQLPHFKVRSFHSNRLGLEVLKLHRDVIYKQPSVLFDGYCTSCNGKVFEFYPTPSLFRLLFPKIYGFGRFPSRSLYTLYRSFYDFGKGSNISFDQYLEKFLTFYNHPFESDLVLSKEFFNFSEDFYLGYLSDRDIDRIRVIYTVSKHFFKFVCDGQESLLYKRFCMIRDFYDDYGLFKLNKFYQTLEENQDKVLVEYYMFLYPDTYAKDEMFWKAYQVGFPKTGCYELVKYYADSMLLSRIKHLEMTDLFLNINKYGEHLSCP